MSLQETIALGNRPDADLDRLIDTLVSPEAPLPRRFLDEVAERVIAGGEPSLGARLILTIHGRDAVLEARRLAERLTECFPEDAEFARARQLVAPPRVVSTRPFAPVDRRADFSWLQDHAAEYPGEWLILSAGRLWAHSPSLPEAQEQAREAGLQERPLLHHVGDL